MGTLSNPKKGMVWPLAARTLVGRSAACTLRLADVHASSEHARITWTGGSWELRDLGSKNGTFLGGERLEAGRAVPLSEGARIGFGGPDEDWVLSDAAAPALVAVEARSGQVREGTGELLVLPSAERPEVSIYRNEQGAWVIERGDGEVESIADEATVAAGGATWSVRVPAAVEGTPLVDGAKNLATVSFRFAVSRDEERVEVTVIHRGVGKALEVREHGYLLVTLARLRLADRDKPIDDRGWVDRDKLLKMLHVDANALNVAIHRARHQLIEAGIDNAASIVEVRRGQRRLGTDRVTLTTLDD